MIRKVVAEERKPVSPWYGLVLMLGVAVVSMLATIWWRSSGEPEGVGLAIPARQQPPAPIAVVPAPASVPAMESSEPEPPAEPPSESGLLVTNTMESPSADPPAPAPRERRGPRKDPPREAAAVEKPLGERDKALLDELGGLTKPQAQQSFGLSRSLWLSAMPKLANHPRILGFLLNNKYVVNGFLSRPSAKASCSSPQAMAAYLSDPTKPDVAIFHQMIRQNPAVAGLVAGSELSSRIIESPGMKGFLKSGGAADAMVKNPELMQLLADPAVINGLAAHANSAVLLDAVPGASRRQ